MDQLSALSSMDRRETRRRRWLYVVAAAALVVTPWIAHRAANVRTMTGRISVDTGCRSDSSTTADMAGLMPGASPIRCEAWDVGTGVTGYVWRAPHARAVVLLQTGWGDYAQRYVNQGGGLIPRLLARSISVYAFDMWGSGRSPGARGATPLREAVADHIAARRALREQALPVFVLGHSVGGLVTATSALGDQTRLGGMILIAPALDWNVPAVMRLVARIGGFLAPTLAVPGTGGWDGVTRDPEARQRLNNDSLVYHGGLSWITASSGTAVSRENWARYRELRVPILVVHGSDDESPDPSSSRAFVGVVSSPDKTLTIIPGGLHALLDDKVSGQTLDVIVGWLDRHLQSPVSR